ncbi:MAG TPA: hypothetical protein VGM92_09430 [Candidatus Kapabacteria bacterium]|jgi:hypothetical protein
MFQSFIRYFALSMLLAATMCLPSFGQSTFPRAGQDFAFGIPQGPDQLLGQNPQSQTTLALTIVSTYSGCGFVRSPSGYMQDFTFEPGTATVIDLPYDLMLLNDLGKSNKGILVHTTEPVNLVFHDYALDAGDATQLLPNSALDTSYVAFSWGIWDDSNDATPEKNTTEILVTAPQDSTVVTITPSVNTLNGALKNVAFAVSLNRGECYILKADSSGEPSDPSLSGTTISSTKPVSVISGLSCAYVPIGVESCNELLDAVIGKKWWGSHFFVQPLGNGDDGVLLVLTSDRDFYARFNNGFANSVNGRLEAEFSGTAEIRTFDINSNPIRVEAQQLTRGSTLNFPGDPTVVTVLDTAYYCDTLLWNTPTFPFPDDRVPIIFPTNDSSLITLDGAPLTTLGAASVINNSAYSATNPLIKPGEHRLLSPDPLFALIAGFDQNDAYSFLPGTPGSRTPKETVSHLVLLSVDSASTCADFTLTATLSAPVALGENLIALTIPITYDPADLHLEGFQPGALLKDGNFTADSSTPGFLTVTLSGTPYLQGSDLFTIVFQAWHSAMATTIGKNAFPNFCGDDSELVTIQPVTFPITPQDSLDRTILVSDSTASLCHSLALAITTDSIVQSGDDFVLSSISIAFDTGAIEFQSATPGNLLRAVPIFQKGGAVGNYLLLVSRPAPISGGDSLLSLQLLPKSQTPNTSITVRVSYLQCGDTIVKAFPLTFPIAIAQDTTSTALTVTTSPVSLSKQALVDVAISGLPPNRNVFDFDLYLTYNHNVMTFDHADLSGTLTGTWPLPKNSVGITTDTLRFTTLAALAATPGMLAHLLFETFVSDSSFSPITIESSLPGFFDGCPEIFSAKTSTVFNGEDLCGDSVLRSVLLGKSLAVEVAEITSGNLHLALQLPASGSVQLALFDLLGRPIWSASLNAESGLFDRTIPLPSTLPAGLVTLEIQAAGNRSVKELIILH